MRHGREPSIVIAFSVPTESAAFRKRGIPDTEIWHLGIGSAQVQANFEARRRQRAAPPEWFISAGFAGGLNPRWERNTVLRPGWVKRAKSSMGDIGISIRGNDPGVVLLTVDHLVATAEAKSRLYESSHCDAVDMETWHLAGRCADLGWRFKSMRVLSDNAGDDLPEAIRKNMAPDGHVLTGRMLWHLATCPKQVPGFIRFVRGLNEAATQLADGLGRMIEDIRKGNAEHPA